MSGRSSRHTLAGAPRRSPGDAISLAISTALFVAFTATGAWAQEHPELSVYDDAGSEEIVIEVGPISLPANAMHGAIEQPPAQRAPIPLAGWLRGFRVTLVDADGRPVPRDLLHHVNVIAPGEREIFSNIMLRIAAAGSETAPIRLPRMLGVPVERGDSLLVTAMFHNPTDVSYDRVYLRARMPYTSEDVWIEPFSVRPFYLDVMPPASGHAYDLPPGRSERSWEGSPAIAGRVLAVGGHLHRYAERLVFEDVTAGEVIWEAEPIEDERGEVVGMPTKSFWWRLGERIRPDHVYRLTAIYDNPTGETIEHGAMGALGGVVMPSDDAEWPAADRDHPEYRLDVRLVTEGAYGPDAPAREHDHASPTPDESDAGGPAAADDDDADSG